MCKRIMTMLVAIILVLLPAVSSLAAWNQVEEGKWTYEMEGKQIRGGWVTDNQENYYLDEDGIMRAGWLQLDGIWYFLNTVHDGTYGKTLKGWHWIDGYCYYFQNDGKMLANLVTPDGYQVNETGAWVLDGKVQYVNNKGIITKQPTGNITQKISSAGGSGGGGGSSGGSGGSKPKNVIYQYTIQYMDIASQNILQIVTGEGKRNDTIRIEYPYFDDYELCEDQKDTFVLTTNNQIVKIYYEKQVVASPSDAEEVNWKVYFVEEGNHSNEIFRSQEGISEEGTELLVDFPESILKNGAYYNATVKSPYKILLYGTGIQKFYIEFLKTELPEEPDPDAPEEEKLASWLDISRAADEEISGTTSMDGQLITISLEESNERIKNLVSMVGDTKRHEVYLIARNHTPSSFVLGQMPNVSSISEMVMDSFQIGADDYVILKIGFEIMWEEETCTHDFYTENQIEAKCLTSGIDSVICSKCGYEVSVIVPATGHQDADQDDQCDICYEAITGNELPEETHYEEGDLQARLIGDKIYLFRCIDADYEDSLNNKQKVALFLCEQVIRSDIDSTSENLKVMSFGGNNNYKSSSVRSWLKKNATDSFFTTHTSYTGIALAYTGATQKGSYEQFDDLSLVGKEKPFQLLEDNIFLLSVEEAVKYSEYLWKFNDSDMNNPESQYSAYSKGYWLRTPQYTESNGQFSYGSGVYIVDLVDGNIHTVDASNSTMGIRPAMTVPQKGGN